jgi:hypothetical protein
VPEPGGPWTLEGFLDRLDAWAEQEHPPDGIRVLVTAWLLSRIEDPYTGVRREPRFPNLWWGVVPGSEHGDGQVVVCSYWVEEATDTVRCDSFATLSWPV